MNGLEFAHAKISFDESSPIIGKFDSRKYRMLEKPLLALDDIRIKRLVCYKASSALGTVFLQIAVSFWLDQRPGSIQCAMQSADDATDWMKVRGRKWINRIPSLRDTMSNDKYAATNSLWLWPYQFLLLTGPGENAQQGKQVTRFVSDESHVDAFSEGDLASFEERMSKRWNRFALHVTTAASEGKEIDRFYYAGGQNEFHLCCPKCHNLTWPLWEDDAKAKYNGEKVFHSFPDSERVLFVCPHCENGVFEDTSRDRYSLHEGADYVSMNPKRLLENESFRWNCFAAHWVPWSEQLNKYREAIEAAKLGNLQPHENFIKKRLCQSYRPEIPDLGDGCGSSDYVIGSVWVTEHEKKRVCSFDVQDAGGFHLWAQCDEFLRNGDSRRLDYQKLLTWQQARAFQEHHGVVNADTFCDAGHRMREVLGRCEEWGWFALFSTDEPEFIRIITNPLGKHLPKVAVRHPYSSAQPEDAMIGTNSQRIQRYKSIPAGYCLSRRWSKPVIGGYLMALKSGNSRYYGIAKDINPDYVAQLNSYTYASVYDKKYGTSSLILKQVKKDDHSFSTSSMCLLGAVIRGFFPLSTTQYQLLLHECQETLTC